MNNKKWVRTWVKEQKKLLSEEERQRQSRMVIKKLLSHPSILHAKMIMAYFPLPDELDVQDLLSELYASGKTVFLPVISDGEIILRKFQGFEQMEPGVFGVQEPCGEEFYRLTEVETVIVPGIAFSRNGYRLGRGKAYYDRFLPKVQIAYKIGVGYDFQLMDEIPTEPHDVRLDEILSAD